MELALDIYMDQGWLALLAPWGKGLEGGLVCIQE